MTSTHDWLKGCATALVTPFTADGKVDEKRVKALAERQIAGSVKLLVPCGTTGERATMDDAEGRRVIELVVHVARGKAKVIAGAGSNNTAQAIHQATEAQAVGADAVLIVAPYYNKPTQEGLLAHFRAVADAVAPLPVMMYNVPGRTSSNIEAATTLKLAREVKNIVAIKEASGNFSQIMAILRDRPAGFRVFSGDDAVTLPLIALGADGIVSVVSNEVPDLMARMTDLALAGKWDEARAAHYRLLPLMEANFTESSPGPVKAAMALMGLLEEQFRLPLVPVKDATRQKMKDMLSALGIAGSSEAHAAA
jgi:4-hydroxy-tetrahydrodipicolinate synthase